jgi:hypothetical protein
VNHPRLREAVLPEDVRKLSARTTTGGIARPRADGAASSSRDGSQSAVCDRVLDPDDWSEYRHTEPATDRQLFKARAADEPCVRRCCAACCPTRPGDSGGGGLLPLRHRLRLVRAVVGRQPGLDRIRPVRRRTATRVSDPIQSDPNLGALIRQVQIAGVPAMTTGRSGDFDGGGRDGEQVTLAPYGDAERPGVLPIHLEQHPPRGRPQPGSTAPVSPSATTWPVRCSTRSARDDHPRRHGGPLCAASPSRS